MGCVVPTISLSDASPYACSCILMRLKEIRNMKGPWYRMYTLSSKLVFPYMAEFLKPEGLKLQVLEKLFN